MTGGNTTAPALVTSSIFSRCIVLSGVSLATSTSLLLSFSITLAARVIKSLSYPIRIAASVFMEHGTTIMPCVKKEPEDREAETSRGEYVKSARDSRYLMVLFGGSTSYLTVAAPHLESMRCVSTLSIRRRWRTDTASGAPVAPVTATMMRLRGIGRAREDCDRSGAR
jgi:hypothetical protein